MRATTLDLTNSGVGIGTTSTTILSVDKPISEVKVGDYVLNKDGTQENEVDVVLESSESNEISKQTIAAIIALISLFAMAIIVSQMDDKKPIEEE